MSQLKYQEQGYKRKKKAFHGNGNGDFLTKGSYYRLKSFSC